MRSAAIVTALAAVLAAGCGSSSHRSVIACRLFAQSSDVSVELRAPGSASDCAATMRQWSGGGAFWSRHDARPGHARPVVCRLHGDGGSVIVRDRGSASNGRALCGDFVRAGFVEQ